MSEPFEAFFPRREAAALAYVNGDGAPLDALVAQAGEGSFHSPGGDTVSGAAEVAARYAKDVGGFDAGSTNQLEVLQRGESGGLAFWTGFQVAEVRFKGKDEAVPMRIRVTEVFRRTGGEWKMIHRHADMPPQR